MRFKTHGNLYLDDGHTLTNNNRRILSEKQFAGKSAMLKNLSKGELTS